MDDDYLKEDFDIGKLTIPKIKKILVENGITEFPTRVKKDQLIEIFKENIDLIRKKKKEEMKSIKKEESRNKNIYQEGRSSIIELEVNKRDGEGGVYTSGRKEDYKDKGKDVGRGKEDDHIGDKGNKFISINKQTPSPKKHPPPSLNDNTSFLDSLSAHLRSTSRRRKSLEDINSKSDINISKKVIVDVDSGVSDTSFFSSQNDINRGNRDKVILNPNNKDKLIIPSTTPTIYTNYLYFLLIPFLLIPFYFLLPYCTNSNFICLPVPKNGKILNGKLICDNGFILKKSFLREKCIKDSKEIRMLKKINFIIEELEILKGDYKYGLVKDYKKRISDVVSKDIKDKGDYKDYLKGDNKSDNILMDDDHILIEILKHSPKVKFHNDLIYAVNPKFTLKSFIRHYSLKAFYLLLLILSLTLVFYIFYKRRQGILERKYSSQKIVKEILNILLRQMVISTKNTRFPGFVYVDHLKDVFLVEKGLWEMVKENVEKNSNVKKGEIENKETWEWVGPYVENGVI